MTALDPDPLYVNEELLDKLGARRRSIPAGLQRPVVGDTEPDLSDGRRARRLTPEPEGVRPVTREEAGLLERFLEELDVALASESLRWI